MARYPVLYGQWSHPRANKKKGFVLEHIVIAEKALGKYLPAGAEVHHVDSVRDNNANTNLVICQDSKYHRLLHTRKRVYEAGGNPNTDLWCSRCQRPRPSALFRIRVSGWWAGSPRTACIPCEMYYTKMRKREAATERKKMVPAHPNNGDRKLTEDQALEILALRGVVPQSQLAARYHVSRTTISSIHIGRNYIGPPRRES